MRATCSARCSPAAAMNPSIPTPTDEADVRSALKSALQELLEIDGHLLKTDCNERSITHRLAVHLAKHFPNHDIDCEYNRDGHDTKKLQLSKMPSMVSTDASDAATVFPDVIVHVRGCSCDNLLVVELKKSSSSVNSDRDLEKLRAFKRQLGYTFAVHVVVEHRHGASRWTEEWQ